ncbi:Glutathione S-transferase 5 [Datura stramonium]|uniref:Glutathione S-transferase n=1 Tax=Datura stramonium TaxID=4076 RepID=A0ABS8WFV9_DATST|nr:Glutathione S-transferase 5 [Datura stramonium]
MAKDEVILLDFWPNEPLSTRKPCFIYNGKPICESIIGVEYIDEVWKDKAPLLPSDPYEKAQVRFWADYIKKKVKMDSRQDSSRKIWAIKGEEHEAGKKDFRSSKVLEGNTLEKTECPKFVAWGKRCMQRDSVAKSLPDQHKILDMFGMRLRIAPYEKEVNYEYREEDLKNKRLAFLQMNPIHKKTSVLIHNGKPICESNIELSTMMKYGRTEPCAPSDPYDRAC